MVVVKNWLGQHISLVPGDRMDMVAAILHCHCFNVFNPNWLRKAAAMNNQIVHFPRHHKMKQAAGRHPWKIQKLPLYSRKFLI